MEKKKAISLVILGIMGSCIISGCTSMPIARRSSESGEGARTERPLRVAAALRFEDLPVPENFSPLRDQSFVFQDDRARVGLMRYTGRANANQVVTFFKTQMGLYNWDLINIVEHGSITMNFLKSNESCVVTVEPLTTKTVLSVLISPRTGTFSSDIGSKKNRF
ncbi:MAG: hypothetical protein NC828_05355 [Candidatus Omnitrophica bacterium]|nr:hypothetical protein [Candidatus Omnitrophota bacterium]